MIKDSIGVVVHKPFTKNEYYTLLEFRRQLKETIALYVDYDDESSNYFMIKFNFDIAIPDSEIESYRSDIKLLMSDLFKVPKSSIEVKQVRVTSIESVQTIGTFIFKTFPLIDIWDHIPPRMFELPPFTVWDYVRGGVFAGHQDFNYKYYRSDLVSLLIKGASCQVHQLDLNRHKDLIDQLIPDSNLPPSRLEALVVLVQDKKAILVNNNNDIVELEIDSLDTILSLKHIQDWSKFLEVLRVEASNNDNLIDYIMAFV